VSGEDSASLVAVDNESIFQMFQISVKSLKLVIYYIRPEDSADMQLHPSIDIDIRLNELEVMSRSLLLTPCSDDYLSLIIANMNMIQILESPADSY
jgi:hypothetical protein